MTDAQIATCLSAVTRVSDYPVASVLSPRGRYRRRPCSVSMAAGIVRVHTPFSLPVVSKARLVDNLARRDVLLWSGLGGIVLHDTTEPALLCVLNKYAI